MTKKEKKSKIQISTVTGTYTRDMKHRDAMKEIANVVGKKLLFFSKTSIDKIEKDLYYLKNKLGIEEDPVFEPDEEEIKAQELLIKDIRRRVVKELRRNVVDKFLVYCNNNVEIKLYPNTHAGVADFVAQCNSEISGMGIVYAPERLGGHV